jgi:hypothetical protein
VRGNVPVLIAQTGPRDGGIELDEELRAIQRGLRQTPYGEALDVQVCPAARPDDLVDALLRHDPVVLHLSGRGDHDGFLFRADDGAETPINPVGLAKLLATAAPRLRLLVVNACWSAGLAADLAAAIGCCIGVDTTISITAATGFSEVFYRSLGYGHPVGRAFEIGVSALEFYGEPDHAVIGIHPGTAVDPDQLFIIPPELMPAAPRDAVKPTALPVTLRAKKTVHVELDVRLSESDSLDRLSDRLGDIGSITRFIVTPDEPRT